ncbi:efflux RND transporter periplasmic adaptor subunit [Tindallia californiensis]|uniref:HlyD family secretion protein n=1 Tax=Tindallia californiensis TaxID=159292 RepID=A0A1H3LHT6_9FIRM|nr:efflux RND transporter periplasmic adaptor subunit [Tindallia californiensis]SDY63528.1 HlyD family secretion protein [Tindallia californiensis]
MKKRKKKKQMVITLLLLTGLIGVVVFWINQPEERPVTVVVKKESMESLVEEIGELKAESRRRIVANRGGEIGKLPVKAGDWVDAGHVLAEIDHSDWRLKINQLTDEMNVQKNEYQQRITLSNRQQEKALASFELAEKELAEAIDYKHRIKKLYEAGAAPEQELTDAKLEVNVHENNVKQAALQVEAARDQISASVQESYLAKIRQLEREINHAEVQRNAYHVKAPVSGTVLRKLVEEGAYVQPGQDLYELGDLSKMYVAVDLLAREMKGIKEGMPVRVSHRDLGEGSVKGNLRKIEPVAVITVSELGVEQRRVRVEISLEGFFHDWRPGYEVDVEIIREVRENVLTIPERSVFWKDAEPHVLVWNGKEGEERRVELGMDSRGRVQVVAGLEEGEEVVRDPS